MRQVPRYAIIGNGRLAQHIAYYFQLSGISYCHWYRQLSEPLAETIATATHVLILIKDAAIDSFIQAHPIVQHKILIHGAASYLSAYAYSCHPLMTFSKQLYELSRYQQIPFILDDAAPDFTELFPQLPNPWRKMKPADKAYYHALCVMANNFTTLLWQKFFTELTQRFDMAPTLALPFLQQTFDNLKIDYQTALTGPLVREDHATLANNLNALTGDAFAPVYEAFVSAYHNNSPRS